MDPDLDMELDEGGPSDPILSDDPVMPVVKMELERDEEEEEAEGEEAAGEKNKDQSEAEEGEGADASSKVAKAVSKTEIQEDGAESEGESRDEGAGQEEETEEEPSGQSEAREDSDEERDVEPPSAVFIKQDPADGDGDEDGDVDVEGVQDGAEGSKEKDNEAPGPSSSSAAAELKRDALSDALSKRDALSFGRGLEALNTASVQLRADPALADHDYLTDRPPPRIYRRDGEVAKGATFDGAKYSAMAMAIMGDSLDKKVYPYVVVGDEETRLERELRNAKEAEAAEKSNEENNEPATTTTGAAPKPKPHPRSLLRSAAANRTELLNTAKIELLPAAAVMSNKEMAAKMVGGHFVDPLNPVVVLKRTEDADWMARKIRNMQKNTCAVWSCPRPYPVKTRFLRMPAKARANPDMVRKWLAACRCPPSKSLANMRVCDRHFYPEDYDHYLLDKVLFPNKPRPRLKDTAVPTRNMTGDPDAESRNEGRRRRRIRREQKVWVDTMLRETQSSKEIALAKILKPNTPAEVQEAIDDMVTLQPVPPEETVPHPGEPLPGPTPKPRKLTEKQVDTIITKFKDAEKKIEELEMQLGRAKERAAEAEARLAKVDTQKKEMTSKYRSLYAQYSRLQKKWAKREEIFVLTEKQKLKYAKEAMHEYTCWSKPMISAFLDKITHVKWCEQDYQMALNIYAMSPRTYRYLRNLQLLPLPAKSTLRRPIVTAGLCVTRRTKEDGSGIDLYAEPRPVAGGEGEGDGEGPEPREEREDEGGDRDEDDDDEVEDDDEREEEDGEEEDDDDGGEDDDEEEEDEEEGGSDIEMIDESAAAESQSQPKAGPSKAQSGEPGISDDFLASLMEEVG